MSKTIQEKIRRTAKKLYVVRVLGGCCESCGETRFYVLNFHHENEDKEYELSRLKGHRLSKILSEANKCKLFCANCHQKYHLSFKNKKLSRNTTKETLLKYLNVNCCESCGESEQRILAFHHTRDKLYEITNRINNLIIRDISGLPQDLKDEVDKCIVLCHNCHLEEHFDKEFFKLCGDEILEKSYNLKEIQPKLDWVKVKDMFLCGMKQIQIANYFNASKGTINGILKSYGLTTPMEDILVDKEKVIKLNSNGDTNKEIEKSLSYSKSSIQRILKEENLKSHRDPDSCKHLRKFDPTPEELSKQLETMSYRELGTFYGVSHIAVFNRKKKFDKMKNNS